MGFVSFTVVTGSAAVGILFRRNLVVGHALARVEGRVNVNKLDAFFRQLRQHLSRVASFNTAIGNTVIGRAVLYGAVRVLVFTYMLAFVRGLAQLGTLERHLKNSLLFLLNDDFRKLG